MFTIFVSKRESDFLFLRELRKKYKIDFLNLHTSPNIFLLYLLHKSNKMDFSFMEMGSC